MKLYTYTIHYTTSLVTEMKDCEAPIDWEKVKPGSIFRFGTPDGSQTVNMAHVTTIVEEVRELDDRYAEGLVLEKALARNHYSATKTAEDLGCSPRTVYRKAKEHGLNVKKD